MTDSEAAERTYARRVLLKSAFEVQDEVTAEFWLREVEVEKEALVFYQGDRVALLREARAIAALVWGEAE